MLTFSRLAEANIERQNESDPHERQNARYFAGILEGEMKEAQDKAEKIIRELPGASTLHTTNFELADELAGVIIYCDLLATSLGISLEEAVFRVFNRASEEKGLRTRL